MSDDQIIEVLSERAVQKLGRQRAEKLRPEIEQLAADLKELYSVPVELDDEP
ncbi:MAG TPA: hypothetical protein VE422_27445 [Terriglobia bacterium]|nr:hypothetical protein [Terriglobia bacterium]